METAFQPLTDEQWLHLEPFFPNPPKRSRGKPHAAWRAVLNSILLVLLTKVKWSAIPVTPDYAAKSVSHRWFAIWDKSGFLHEILAKVNGLIQEAKVSFPPRRKRFPKSKLPAAPVAVSA